MHIGAVVMASGQSERFGKRDKLCELFAGVPLVCRTLEALPQDGFEKRLVVTRSEQIAELARACGFEALLHDLPDVSDTIRLGTREMARMDGCLYCVGDQPFLNAQTVAKLLSAFERAPGHIWRVAYGGAAGNPVLFPRALFGELASLSPGQTGGAVIRAHPDLVSTVEAASALEMKDIDTEDDFWELQKECENHAAHR